MMDEKRDFYTIRDDIIVLLREIKELNQIPMDEMTEFLSSFLTFVEPSTKADLAKEIYFYQHNMHGSFKMNLYKMFYGADKTNLSLLAFTFPKEVAAFLAYGRAGEYTIKEIMEGDK